LRHRSSARVTRVIQVTKEGSLRHRSSARVIQVMMSIRVCVGVSASSTSLVSLITLITLASHTANKPNKPLIRHVNNRNKLT
jgi:hypothetical protein